MSHSVQDQSRGRKLFISNQVGELSLSLKIKWFQMIRVTKFISINLHSVETFDECKVFYQSTIHFSSFFFLSFSLTLCAIALVCTKFFRNLNSIKSDSEMIHNCLYTKTLYIWYKWHMSMAHAECYNFTFSQFTSCKYSTN